MIQPQDVTTFWRQAGPEKWYGKSDGFDESIRLRFEAAHYAAARRAHDDWMGTPEGALALLLLLDQIPRNLFRHTAHAFATDSLARALARQAHATRQDLQVEPILRQFFYLPFEHHEDEADQALAVALFEALETVTGDPEGLRYARLHKDIIDRFGRFPHRNAVLGRETTPAEQQFLDDGGFAG